MSENWLFRISTDVMQHVLPFVAPPEHALLARTSTGCLEFVRNWERSVVKNFRSQPTSSLAGYIEHKDYVKFLKCLNLRPCAYSITNGDMIALRANIYCIGSSLQKAYHPKQHNQIPAEAAVRVPGGRINLIFPIAPHIVKNPQYNSDGPHLPFDVITELDEEPLRGYALLEMLQPCFEVIFAVLVRCRRSQLAPDLYPRLATAEAESEYPKFMTSALGILFHAVRFISGRPAYVDVWKKIKSTLSFVIPKRLSFLLVVVNFVSCVWESCLHVY
jgi:hypothetical protein